MTEGRPPRKAAARPRKTAAKKTTSTRKTAAPAAPKVPKFGPGGTALWAALWSEKLPEQVVALVTEACRVRDRLDRLDEILRGDVGTWASIDVDDRGNPISLRIDAALASANTTATTFRALLEQIAKTTTTTTPAVPAPTVRSPVDELRARRSGKAPTAPADPKAAR